jgi:hypothetical protein
MIKDSFLIYYVINILLSFPNIVQRDLVYNLGKWYKFPNAKGH